MSERFYCQYCGHYANTVASLTASSCANHPDGSYKGKHTLYEGHEKSEYSCKYCGKNASSIPSITIGTCENHPDGRYKGHHVPAL